MAKLPNTVSQISSSSNGREVCEAPEVCKVAESSRLLRRRSVSICAAESLLEFALVDGDSRARPGTCKERPE
jgi:hypothetical protein